MPFSMTANASRKARPDRGWQAASFVEAMILVAALSILGGYMAWNLSSDHGRIERQERERLSAQTSIIDENLVPQLIAVDHALTAIRRDLPSMTASADSATRIDHHLESLHDAMPGVQSMAIFDDQGTIVASDRAEAIGQNFHEREYFQVARRGADPAVLYVSSPLTTTLGTRAIILTRVIPDDQGRFAGLVSAIIDPVFFTTLMRSVRYAPDMWSGLIHGDGKIFVTVPELSASNQDLAKPGTPFSRFIESGRTSDILIGNVLVGDKDERMLAQRLVRPASLPMDKPLVISLNRNLSAIFAEWRHGAYQQGGLFGVLVLLTSTGFFVRQRRQRAFAGISAMHEAENKRAGAALKAKTELLQNVIDSSVDFIFVKDRRLRTVLCNTAFAQALGKTPVELYGKTDIENGWSADLILGRPEEGMRGFQRDDLAALSGQRVHSFGDLDVGGNIRIFDSLKVPLRSADGEIIGLLGVSRDITEQRQAEEQLTRLRADLHRTLEWQVARQTAAALAHEVNQPLGSISILCEAASRLLAAECADCLAIADSARPGRLDQVLKRMAAESERAGGVIHDLLRSLQRPDNKLEPISLSTLLPETARMAEADSFGDCQVAIDCPADLPSVLINRMQVQKVLMNLIGNSVEAMRQAKPPSQRVWINVGRTADNAMARITVRDEGPGVKEKRRIEIFHPFVTTKPAGTGMGLAISRALIETMGGKLWCQADDGAGAKFHFTLPFAG